MLGMSREELLAFNQSVIEEFRENDGVCGGPFEGNPMLLLTTRGARTGEARTTPLTYHLDGDRHVVMASAGGSPTHPAWFGNLSAHPEVVVEVGSERFDAAATSPTGEERERLFADMVAALPRFGDYQAQVERVIPLVVLSRR